MGIDEVYLYYQIKGACIKVRAHWGKIKSSSLVLKVKYLVDWYTFEGKRKR